MWEQGGRGAGAKGKAHEANDHDDGECGERQGADDGRVEQIGVHRQAWEGGELAHRDEVVAVQHRGIERASFHLDVSRFGNGWKPEEGREEEGNDKWQNPKPQIPISNPASLRAGGYSLQSPISS